MAGDWIKWTKGLIRRREVLGIASRMSIAPTHAAGLCMAFWEWLDDNITATQIDENGNACVTLGPLQPDFIDSLVCVSGFAAAMTAEGWLCASSGSLTVPNYCRHNGQTSKDRALTAERVSKNRSNKQSKCNGATVTPVTVAPLPEKRREEKKYNERTNARATEILSLDSEQTEVWAEVKSRGNTIWVKLRRRFERDLPQRDKEELAKALYLSILILSADWINEAIDAVLQKKPNKPGAYMRTCLTDNASKLGYDYHQLMKLVKIPDGFFKKVENIQPEQEVKN